MRRTTRNCRNTYPALLVTGLCITTTGFEEGLPAKVLKKFLPLSISTISRFKLFFLDEFFASVWYANALKRVTPATPDPIIATFFNILKYGIN